MVCPIGSVQSYVQRSTLRLATSRRRYPLVVVAAGSGMHGDARYRFNSTITNLVIAWARYRSDSCATTVLSGPCWMCRHVTYVLWNRALCTTL